MKTYFTGWIKPGDYGHKTIDGIDYIERYPVWARPILRVTKLLQRQLWKLGIAVHDPVFGECTPDFNCCCKNIGRKVFLRIKE